MWGTVISLFGDIFSDYQKERLVKKQYKAKLEEATVMHKIKRIEDGDSHAMSMDLTERKNAGWMDDFSFYRIYDSCYIMFFILQWFPHVRTGFEVLGNYACMVSIWFRWNVNSRLGL